jgi:hypothetical protein
MNTSNLGVNVHAINPTNPLEPIDGFTSFPAAHNVYDRKNQLVNDIRTGGWKRWSGERRRDWIATALRNGWKINVQLVMLDLATTVLPSEDETE